MRPWILRNECSALVPGLCHRQGCGARGWYCQRARSASCRFGSGAVKDARIGGDSLIDLAIMYQMRSPSSACAGLDADDRVSVLPGGRAMVSPAVTYRTGLRNCPSDRQYLFHGLLTSEALKKVSTNPPDLRHGAARATFRPTGFATLTSLQMRPPTLSRSGARSSRSTTSRSASSTRCTGVDDFT